MAPADRPSDRKNVVIRDRLLRPRWLVWLVVVWGVVISAAPRSAAGAPLPPTRADGTVGGLEEARALLEHPRVEAAFRDLGLSASDATELWERLTPAERAELAARVDELRTGGDPLAAGVAIAIIVAMALILILELLGRRIISRP
jgi:hypothetical protein